MSTSLPLAAALAANVGADDAAAAERAADDPHICERIRLAAAGVQAAARRIARLRKWVPLDV